MAKKKKSRFKIRYLLVLLIMYLLYKILVVSLPVGKVNLSYYTEVTENKKEEIGKIVKKTGLDDLNKLKNSIESLSWVDLVHLNRNILGSLRIIVVPRVPKFGIAGAGGKVIDKKGYIFSSDKADSLPVVELARGISREEVAKALGVFEVLNEFNIDEVQIARGKVTTKNSNCEVIWGNDEFVRKYGVLKRILGDNISEFKGTLDFRFKNMVVLRR